MKKYFFTFLMILNHFSTDLISQDKNTWTAFEDSTTGLYGFKDDKGNVKVEPEYLGFAMAQKFSEIIGVMDDYVGIYYLLKNGNKFGSDSVFLFDNSFDCESEGYIRFSDKKNETVGMFNSEGKVVIPAEYNLLTKVRNGLVVGIKGAKKEYWNNDSTDEHWSLKGGTKYLIDIKNNILIKDFPGEDNLDYHSILVGIKPSSDPIRDSFAGVNGKYYSFVNNEKLFKNWLRNNFLNDFSKNNLIKISYSKIVYWSENSGWVSKPGKDFWKDNYDLIKKRFADLKSDSANYFFTFEDHLITLPQLEHEFDVYRDNCGNVKSTQYPLMNVTINHKLTGDYQDNIGFLKTVNGFKLMSISLGNTHPK